MFTNASRKRVVVFVFTLIGSCLFLSGSFNTFLVSYTISGGDIAENSDNVFRPMPVNHVRLGHTRHVHVDHCSQLQVTSNLFSKVKLKNIANGTVTVTIETYTKKNVRKTVGGDVILMWAMQTNGAGRAPGNVFDNMDGSYTGQVQIYWNEQTIIKVKVASSSRNICLHFNALRRYGNVAYSLKKPWGIRGLFKSGWVKEETRCGTSDSLYGYSSVCNFTSLNDKTPWYCGKPRHSDLRCDHIYSFNSGLLNAKGIRQNESITESGHGILKEHIVIDIQGDVSAIKPSTSCTAVTPRVTWTKSPSAYINKSWTPLYCKYNTAYSPSRYRTCLKNKTVVFIGDSTIRQYFEYFCEHVLDLGHVDTKFNYGPNRTYHPDEVFQNHNISMLYRKHELPFHNPDVRPHGIISMPTLLTRLANSSIPDDSLIIVVNYYVHLQAYPPSDYRRRLSRLASAIKTLLAAKPRAKLLYKGPNVSIQDDRWYDPHFALMYRDILFEEFSDLMDHVIYLDVWGITVAHNSELLHPQGDCLKSHIQQFMSFVCE